MSIIVVGAGEVGYHVAKRLSLENKDVTVIDKDPEKIKKVQESLDVHTVNGIGSSLNVLQNAGLEDADMIVAVTDSDEVNMVSCLVASAQTKIPAKIARIRNLEHLNNPEILKRGNLNIDLVINPEYEAVASIVKLLQVPGATDVVDFNDGRVKLIGYTVQNPIFQNGISLEEMRKQIKIDEVVITAIYRDGEVIIPRGKDIIFCNNLIYAITTEPNIQSMTNFFGKTYTEIKKSMIIGGSNVGVLLAQEFEKAGIATKIIESDQARCVQIADELNNTVVLHQDGEADEILKEEHIESTDVFAAVTSDEENNILLSLLAKRLGAKKVIALIHNITYTPLVSNIGIDTVVNSNLCAVNRILQFIRKGKVLSVASFYEKNAEAIEALALETSDLVNKPIKKIKFPKHAIIGAIIRDEKVIIPHGDTTILPGDRVIIFAISSVMHEVEKALMVKLEYW